MGKDANVTRDLRQDLTNGATPWPVSAEASGLSVAKVLEIPALSRAHVLAGGLGLDRLVRRVNVMEVPDVLPWVQADQLLLTTGYPLRRHADELGRFIRELDDRGLAGLCIKLNRYLDEVPGEALAVADELGIPLVSLPDGVGFDEILNQAMTRLLDRRAEDLARSEQMLAHLVDIVLSGGDLDQVCHGLVGPVTDAAVVTTMDGRVLAAATGPGRTPESLLGLECFDRTGRFRVEAEATGRVTTDAEGLHRLAVPVRARGRHEGRLVVFRAAPLTAGEVHIVEQAAASAALVMAKEQAIAGVENKYRADFLRDALAGRAGPAERVLSHARSLGWDLDRPVAVVVAHIDEGASGRVDTDEERSLQERFARAWQQTVLAADPQAPVAGYSQEVVAVVGLDADIATADAQRVVAGHARSVRGDGGGGRRPFTTGVSSVVTSVDELPRAYSEACKAVAVGRRLHGPGAVTHFESLGVFRLLSLVAPEELRDFAAETLGPLARDNAEAEDLRRTLTALLDHNLNVAETSRALHFHYNTLRYRITKLEQMLGPFTSDPHRRFSIALALHVVQMRGI
ncbi:PucR family transcriptional regulator [Mariniluteicoccus endophyticus]